VLMRHVARNCSPCCWPLALALIVPDLAVAQEPAPAEPAVAETRAKLEAIYSEANAATQAGDFAAAADRYGEALALLPETQANHESRALALLDSVGARREAFTRSRDPLQLCRARDVLRSYLVTARTTYGAASSELDGPRQAARIHGEVEIQIASELASPPSGPEHAAPPSGPEHAAGPDLAPGTCPGDQKAAPPAPARKPEPVAEPPPRRDPRRIAGIAMLGVAGGSLALMGAGLGIGAAAESSGAAAHMADPAQDIDALLSDGFYQRGVAANRLAIAGAVLAGVALVTGAALLIASRPRKPRVGLRGPGLVLRF